MENIREAGDTTISFPGRSSKQPLPGMRLHDPLCSASLPQIHRISPGGWSNLSPVGDIFVPFPLETGANMLHPLPPQSLNLQYIPSMRVAAQKETPRESSRKYSHNCGVAEDRLSTSRFSIPPWRDVDVNRQPSFNSCCLAPR